METLVHYCLCFERKLYWFWVEGLFYRSLIFTLMVRNCGEDKI
jgi:hypothetical protein